MNDSDLDKPATKRDLQDFVTKVDLDNALTRMENFVLKRETALYWRFLTLGLALLAAQWAAITWMMSHWKP
jgi:hypothetical protein